MAEKLNFTVDLEDGVFVARCIELDITTDGLTKAEAVENLKEALNCYFADAVEWGALFKLPDAGPPGLWRLAYPVNPDESDEALRRWNNDHEPHREVLR